MHRQMPDTKVTHPLQAHGTNTYLSGGPGPAAEAALHPPEGEQERGAVGS